MKPSDWCPFPPGENTHTESHIEITKRNNRKTGGKFSYLHGEEVSFVFSTNHIESDILKSDLGPDQMYLIGYVLDFLQRDCRFF